MGKFVGIDLGTTYSVVAYINAQGKAEVIPNENGRSVTPSVIYFGGSVPIVGDVAKEQQEAGDTEIVSFVKRSMDDPQFLRTFYGREYTAIDLSALILSYMKKQAENFFGEPVTAAVITVPAYFNHHQRTATIAAGQQAGLNVLKIISEPTAAALAYGLRPSLQTAEQLVLVYDLGGGTFDISLVSLTPTDLVVIATGGDSNLGGKDWDERLILHLAAEFEHEYNVEMSHEEMNLLLVQAEKLKRSLSLKQSADIRVQAAGHVGTYTITREHFEGLTRDLMERTQKRTAEVLREAGKTWQDLSGILPVGGSTKMPMVIDYIKQMSGKQPMGGINPDEAVGLGAAIQAAMEMEAAAETTMPQLRLAGRKRTVDVIAHSLGLIVESSDRSYYLNSIIIPKNLPIPAKQMRSYLKGVRRGGRTELEVFLTQSEEDNPQNCIYLGRYVFSDFPKNIKGKTATLDIAYEYDKNGVVHVSAVERSTGKPLTLTVSDVPANVPARFIGSPTEHDVSEPLCIYLAFDVSGSMYVKKRGVMPLDEAKRAAVEFVNRCSNMTMTSIGLIAFSDRVHVEQEATTSKELITKAIHRLPTINTGTSNNADPFDEILYRLKNVEGLRFAIVLTDGLWIHQEEAVPKAKFCHEADIEVIAVGFGGANHGFLNRIASSPEQSFFTDLSLLAETFTRIAQELNESGGELPLRLGDKTR